MNMGSRIMHLIIGNKIAEQLAINGDYKKAFLLGSIAPDAVSNKDLSHFFNGEVKDYTRFVDFEGFLRKYYLHNDNYYILGYYTHLIADDIWLKGFFLPWLRNRMEADKEIFTQYHNDFRLLNGKLLDYYHFTDELKSCLNEPPGIIDIVEVKSNEIKHFIPHIFSDMDYNEEMINEPLNVFTLQQIVGYIETSVDKGLMHLKLLKGKGVNNFKDLGEFI